MHGYFAEEKPKSDESSDMVSFLSLLQLS